MKRKLLFIVSMLLLIASAAAQDAAKLANLRVVGHHYTTRVCGVPKTMTVGNPSEGRWLVMKFEATGPGGMKIYAHDFIIRYFHADGKEDRASCDGIADCESGTQGEYGMWWTQTEPSIKVSGGRVFFGLTAYIEGDVDHVDILRAGCVSPLRYRLGSDRAFSVFLSTNGDAAALSNAERLLTSAGYSVITSTGLDESVSENVIHYSPKAEGVASKIIQALESGIHGDFVLREANLASEYDIVIWIARKQGRLSQL